MNIGNAVAFCVIGLGMILCPACVSELFPPNKGSGISFSGVWMIAMGWLNALLGGGFLVRYSLVPQILRLVAWRPSHAEGLITAEILRPALRVYAEMGSDEQLRGNKAA